LTYTPAPGKTGSATITLVLKDNGGTANGGQDTSASRTFEITVDNVVRPDLTWNTLSGSPTTLSVGDSLMVSWNYEIVTKPVLEDYGMLCVLSVNQTYGDGDDIELFSRQFVSGSDKEQGAHTGSRGAAIPAGTQAGKYYLLGKLDPTDAVDEAKGENNNIVVGEQVITVVDGPPLWTGMVVATPASGTPSPGSVTVESDKVSVVGYGRNIWGAADQFYFAYRQVTGDFKITAKLDEMTAGSPTAKSGIMVRTGLGASDRFASILLCPNESYSGFYRRWKLGGTVSRTVHEAGEGQSVKLVRRGTRVDASVWEGGKWVAIGYTTIAPRDVYVGFAVCSRNTSPNTSVFSKATLVSLSTTRSRTAAAPTVVRLAQSTPFAVLPSRAATSELSSDDDDVLT